MEYAIAGTTMGRHDADQPAEQSRRMWRIAERALGVTFAAAAITGAIWLGVTAPGTSPVSPVPVQAATGAGNAAGVVAPDPADGFGGGDRGPGDAGGRGRR